MLLENFIVFEGIDGAGTTTQLKILQENENTKNFLFTAEPSSCPTGKFLRQVLKGEVELSNQTITYLFATDRCEHVNGKLLCEGRNLISGIENACKNNKIVISDRYFFSSLAYQGLGTDGKLVQQLNSAFPLPKLLFYFDISAKSAIERIQKRGEQKEIFEKLDFLTKAIQEYKKVLTEYQNPQKNQGMKIVFLNAELQKEEISKIIWNEIQNLPIFNA